MRVAMDMVPARGVARYDALRQMLRGVVAADDGTPEHGLAWDLLHSHRARTRSGARPKGARGFRAQDFYMTGCPQHDLV